MDEDDDFGFLPAGRSRLSSLFPANNIKEEDINQSLTFVPPKQPKKTGNQQSSGSKNLQLIHAVAAYAYKLEGGQYISLGKLGTAILGDNETASYTILLYKGKQQQVTRCTVTLQFKFSIEPNNYAKFPDDKGEQWSVMFGSEVELINFSKQVALAKVNSSGKSLSKLVVQDLISGEGKYVENGDSVEIIYNGSLFKNFGFGEVFDENSQSEKPFIVRIGKSKVVKGLTEGLLGVKKGMRRLIVIPPSLGYGAEGFGNVVPPNATLIFEVIVNRVKISREESHSPSPSRKESESKPSVPPRTHSVSEDTIRSRGASISEQLTQSPRKDNAKLISRMAKMGLPTLPMQGAVPAVVHTSSESEPEKELDKEQPLSRKQSTASPRPSISHIQREAEQEEEVTHVTKRKHASTSKSLSPQIQREVDQDDEVAYFTRRKHASTPKASSPQMQVTNVPYPTYSASTLPLDAAAFVHQPFQTHTIAPIMPSMVPGVLESHIPLLISETRTQNTEVRLTLAKISDKVDTVLQKIDDSKSQGVNNSMHFHGQVPYMESTVLMQNIERIVQENVQLKKDMEVKSSKIQELNEKICDILQRNQRFLEESNSNKEQQNDSMHSTSQLQNKVISLENEKAYLAGELHKVTSESNNVQSELTELIEQKTELEKILKLAENDSKQEKDIITSLKEQCDANDSVMSSLRDDLEMSNKQIVQLNEKLKGAEEALSFTRESEERLRSKLAHMANNSGESTKALQDELQAEVGKTLQWKKKYETLNENTRALKDRYDNQITELIKKVKSAAVQSSSQQSSQDFSSEIKRAMNVLYKLLQSEVKASQTYSGTEILQLCLSVIRKVTMSFIEKDQQQLERSNQKVSTQKHISLETNLENPEPIYSAGDHESLPRAQAVEIPVINNADNSTQLDEAPATNENIHNINELPSESEPSEESMNVSVNPSEMAELSTTSLGSADSNEQTAMKHENLPGASSSPGDSINIKAKLKPQVPEKPDEDRKTPDKRVQHSSLHGKADSSDTTVVADAQTEVV